MDAVIVVLGIVFMYCVVCGKFTEHTNTTNADSPLKEDFQCNECNVIQTYKVK